MGVSALRWWSMVTWLARSKSTGVAGDGAARAFSAAPDVCACELAGLRGGLSCICS